MFLDAAPHLQCYLQDLFDFLLAEFAIGIEKLHETTDGLPDGNGISLIQIPAQAEEAVQAVALLLFPKLSDELRQVVGDEAVVVGEVLRAEFRNLPAGKIAVHPVQERGICSHLAGEGIKEAAGFQKDVHALVDISDESHGC